MPKIQVQEAVSYGIGEALVILGWHIEIKEIGIGWVRMEMLPLNEQPNGLTRGDRLWIRRKRDEVVPFSGMKISEINHDREYVILVPIFQS
jgi:hypothetical protein